MSILKVDNYVITTPLYEVVTKLKLSLTNGKLKDIKPEASNKDNIVVTCPNRHHSGGRENSPAMNIYVGDNSKIPYGYCKCWACDFQCKFTQFVAECFESSEDFAKHWLIDNFGILSESNVLTEPDIVIPMHKKKIGLPSNFLDNFQKIGRAHV